MKENVGFFRTLGDTTNKKLENLRVYIVGLNSLGVEVAKLLALVKPQLLTLHSPVQTDETDMLTQQKISFWPRLQRLKKSLRTTNLKIEKEYRPDDVIKHDVLVICGYFNAAVLNFEKIRNGNGKIAIVFGATLGLTGVLLSDFTRHKVYNDGVEPKSFSVKAISKGNPGVVVTAEKNSFRTGDFVSIEGVEGMTQVNGKDCRPVKVISPEQFQIQNTAAFGQYVEGGVATRVRVPVSVDSDGLLEQVNDLSDCSLEETTIKVFLGSLVKFVEANDRMPAAYSTDDLDSIYQLAQKKHGKLDIDEQLFRYLSFTGQMTFLPLVWVIAGWVAFQVIKKSGSYRPLEKMFCLNLFQNIKVVSNGKEFRQSKLAFKPETVKGISEARLAIVSYGVAQLELVNLLLASQIGHKGKSLLVGPKFSSLLHEPEQGDAYFRQLGAFFRDGLAQNPARKIEYLSCDLDQRSLQILIQSLQSCHCAFDFYGVMLPSAKEIRTALSLSCPSLIRTRFKGQEAALSQEVFRVLPKQHKQLTERRIVKWSVNAVLESVVEPLYFFQKEYQYSELVFKPNQTVLSLLKRFKLLGGHHSKIKIDFLLAPMAELLFRGFTPEVAARLTPLLRELLCVVLLEYDQSQLSANEIQALQGKQNQLQYVKVPIKLAEWAKSPVQLILSKSAFQLVYELSVSKSPNDFELSEHQTQNLIIKMFKVSPFISKVAAGLAAVKLVEGIDSKEQPNSQKCDLTKSIIEEWESKGDVLGNTLHRDAREWMGQGEQSLRRHLAERGWEAAQIKIFREGCGFVEVVALKQGQQASVNFVRLKH